MAKRSKNKSQDAGITISFDTLLRAITAFGENQSPFQTIRKQPLPISVSLELIEMAKVMEEKLDAFKTLSKDLTERFFGEDSKVTKGQKDEFEKQSKELLDQAVTLPGKKIPRAMFSESKISTDDLELMLWLIDLG